jgi:hypothetical protein
MMFRAVFWVVTRQYNPEDSSEHQRQMWWTHHLAQMRKIRNAYKMLIGEPEQNRKVRRPKHRWILIQILLVGKQG